MPFWGDFFTSLSLRWDSGALMHWTVWNPSKASRSELHLRGTCFYIPRLNRRIVNNGERVIRSDDRGTPERRSMGHMNWGAIFLDEEFDMGVLYWNITPNYRQCDIVFKPSEMKYQFVDVSRQVKSSQRSVTPIYWCYNVKANTCPYLFRTKLRIADDSNLFLSSRFDWIPARIGRDEAGHVVTTSYILL